MQDYLIAAILLVLLLIYPSLMMVASIDVRLKIIHILYYIFNPFYTVAMLGATEHTFPQIVCLILTGTSTLFPIVYLFSRDNNGSGVEDLRAGIKLTTVCYGLSPAYVVVFFFLYDLCSTLYSGLPKISPVLTMVIFYLPYFAAVGLFMQLAAKFFAKKFYDGYQ